MNSLKEHTINGKDIAVFVRKGLMYQTWVLPVRPVMHQGKNIQKFRSLGARILGEHFVVSQTQEKLRLMTKIQPVKKVKSQRTVESILVPVTTLQTEILWTLKIASNHFSLRLCLGLNKLFRSLFTENEIVKYFQLSKTKCGYIMNFVLAPHFKDLLLKEIKASDCFGVSFDESMNKALQEEQVNVQIRYFSTHNF